MWKAQNWTEYELLDTSDGERLERWGKYTLVRPDPQVIWKNVKENKLWNKADAIYKRSSKGGGAWGKNNRPEHWTINYDHLGLKFRIKPTGFKHTGLFPEQAANWDWFSDLIKKAGRPIKVLNLFAYTGGATVAAAKAGASVTHVDASIRYIVDDCKKFVEREIRRGNRYDAIIMDPPSYGRGPSGEVWKLEDSISEFLTLAEQVLSDDPLFFLISSYTTGLSASTMGYLLALTMKERYSGKVVSDELGLTVSQTGEALPCGAASRWISSM